MIRKDLEPCRNQISFGYIHFSYWSVLWRTHRMACASSLFKIAFCKLQKCKSFSDMRWRNLHAFWIQCATSRTIKSQDMSLAYLPMDYFHQLNICNRLLWMHPNLDHFCSASPIKCTRAYTIMLHNKNTIRPSNFFAFCFSFHIFMDIIILFLQFIPLFTSIQMGTDDKVKFCFNKLHDELKLFFCNQAICPLQVKKQT